MSDEVPAERTRLEPAAAREVLTRALAAELGRTPTPGEVKMVLAQSALETDWWKSMWCWNFGNVTAPRSGPYFTLPTRTGVKRFQPFDSAWRGATFFVAFLRRRFSQAWQLLGSDNPLAFAYALKAENYYEEDPEAYGAALAARYKQLGPADPRLTPVQASAGGAGVLVLLALSWWYRNHLT